MGEGGPWEGAGVPPGSFHLSHPPSLTLLLLCRPHRVIIGLTKLNYLKDVENLFWFLWQRENNSHFPAKLKENTFFPHCGRPIIFNSRVRCRCLGLLSPSATPGTA